jgi:hypothetical protein
MSGWVNSESNVLFEIMLLVCAGALNSQLATSNE